MVHTVFRLNVGLYLDQLCRKEVACSYLEMGWGARAFQPYSTDAEWNDCTWTVSCYTVPTLPWM